ncbi:MAG TPA: nucleoside triphosphate pyrophosphohydrolase [Gemmatimonadales bacterium]|jgi:MazG family protein|nr:nucleoside triphosphate pyrophosphohydrolase [Gemmatimonadales bacterium]
MANDDDASLGRALALVRDLRARCPWDGAQTPETLRPYLVEEALELDHAIGAGVVPLIKAELGDLLLNLAFQMVIAEERGHFDAGDVVRGLEQKMWRRHPHLFGLGEKPKTWERAKQEEGGGKRGTLAGLPPTLPRLLMAYRLQERAAGVGFDWPDAKGPTAKVREELDEVVREVGGGKREALETEIGDLLFAVVNLSRKLGVDPRSALEKANAKFKTRFEAVEKLAGERGIDLTEAGLEVLDRLWDEVKAQGQSL